MHKLFTPPAILRDLGLLAARIILGIVLVAHGWQKFHDWTISGVTGNFTKMGIPAAHLSALFAASVELVGGILLILGLLTPLVALLVVADMLGAFLYVHGKHGIFIDQGGWELVGVIGACALALLGGAGRLSLDGLLGRRRPAGRADRTEAVTVEQSGAHDARKDRVNA